MVGVVLKGHNSKKAENHCTNTIGWGTWGWGGSHHMGKEEQEFLQTRDFRFCLAPNQHQTLSSDWYI